MTIETSEPVNGVNNEQPMEITNILFGDEGKKPASQESQSADETTDDGSETSGADAELESDNLDADNAANSEENAGDSDAGAKADVWDFDGKEYNGEQVGEALKNAQLYQNYNQSITPLVENIRSFGEQAARTMTMATTETEKQIAELQAFLKSGKAEPRQHQAAHQQLMAAETRLETLKQAATATENQRKEALNQARTQNARHVATELSRTGWSQADMAAAEQVARQVMTPDQFADTVSPAMMEMLRDAASYRASQKKAAELLRGKAKGVTTKATQKTPPAPAKKGAELGSSDWVSKTFWKE